MSNALSIIRSLIIYSLCLPLAIFLGYLLAVPLDSVSLIILATALALPLVPVLLRWHHLILIASWNMTMVLFFLPGRPNLWIFMAATSLLVSFLQHILNRNTRFLSVPSVTRPLIFLVIVILVTAKLTGGFGMRTIGELTGGVEAFGGKRYILLLGAIIGYFAITCHRVPEGRAPAYVALYLLGTLTAVIGNLGPYVYSSLWFLFLIFPVENLQFMADRGSEPEGSFALRLGGLTFACMAVACFVLARHGVRGLFALGERWSFLPFRAKGGLAVNHPWRILVFLFMIWVSLLGGYRSVAILLALTFLGQFYLEGLFRSQLLPALILILTLAFVVSLPMVNKLPISVQRSLSFLPIEIDPIARYSAESSSEWRLQIWRNVMPLIPQYLILGKGYAISPAEMQTMQSMSGFQGSGDSTQGATLAGDYHNGPLSVIIPLGVFGAVGFVWFLAAGYRVLLNNYRHGDSELRMPNTFLLAYFVARVIFFFTVFGSFYAEMVVFTGLVGLSVSINGGLREAVIQPVEKPAFNQFKLARTAK